MAVRQRIFNSTAPFSGSSQAELKGSYSPCSAADQEAEEEEEEGKSSKMDFSTGFNPLINRVLTYGTAEQVGEMPRKTSTFIAQAECETQDSQELCTSCFDRFVPTPNCFTSSISSEHNNVACPTTASIQEPSSSSAQLTPRKKIRKRQKRKCKKKLEKKKEKQRHRHRMPSGVPEQESGSSLVQILESSLGGRSDISTSCCSSIESSEEQGRGPSLYRRQIYNTGSSCSPLNWDTVSSLHSYGQDSDSDSLSNLGDCSLALAGLRGSVSQGDRCYALPFFKDVERDVREEEDDLSAADSVSTEGIIFYNEKIQPVDSEYKEGREYVLSQFIKEGSYGEVHSAQDVNTGFKFAVKKIALKRFISEEVGAWSALRSPRVVKLFGVVREGPNVVLFMDHKSGSVGQLIAERGRLPEDLSLHYHSQILTALEYLGKKKVVHLDIKADNVLLSEDGRDTFLCDFGHAERLNNQGQSLSGSKDLKGTETHMAPEIVKGEPRGAKADVWSSCCMLLHMLNACQPWTRYYTCRLYLKIANEPPPLREIPPDCSPLTADVIKAGLQKDPAKRASASDLKVKTARALKEVGGLTSPVKGPYTEPLYITNKPPDSLQLINSSFNYENEDDHQESVKVITTGRRTEKLDDDDDDGDEDKRAGCNESKRDSLFCPQTLISEPNHKRGNKITTVPELELRKLERDFYLSSLSQLHSAEMQEQLLSCLSSDPYSTWEPLDKKDSGRWSLSPGDDFSSGVFSYNSQPDVQVSSMDLLSHTQLPPPCCFEGVDVCIRDFNKRSIRIRETRRVKVGHIATGISDQISERVFTLETQQGQQVAHDEEVQDSGLKLNCVPAPDFSSAWRWRIRDGVLETR
ncbi:mitogen-activated protein kinase kinase kinase 14 [Sander lucioperca]|uniref:Mitogen-activated protein kinase kinase kinase 14a n=1 Tax=Sander lucioperca TaxID=283035 RepID=A0A8C9YLC2_SANLU|nr:mitogen-activated protein kinase kinase kinase 14 [Sander lucioperca]XP_031168115.1 mitogen-activated protein kinase kinase kinase 14 [Sander lucioperca]XP_031168116.1 mitogen-activated protein kinase kinase kinase 14 [Sander lucioperca]XP_031168117.1 mitogen-activated protein kinase kinase kinase 14 [Sander lucioperca]XP_031168118.1 mitogen-activated protein kinase kinase kinase 14 [Sander lucioperca]